MYEEIIDLAKHPGAVTFPADCRLLAKAIQDNSWTAAGQQLVSSV